MYSVETVTFSSKKFMLWFECTYLFEVFHFLQAEKPIQPKELWQLSQFLQVGYFVFL